MVKPEFKEKCDLLKKMLSIAKKLSENESNEIFELGHYLADNILAKICMIVGKDNNRDDLIFKSNGMTKALKNLYNKILKEKYFPEVPNFDYLIENFHRNRNIYQHEWESLELSIRKTEAKKYINEVENIMKIVGILGEYEQINPSNLINNNPSYNSTIVKEKEIEEKFKDLYNRLKSRKSKHINFDISYILKEIGDEQIERVLKLNTKLNRKGYGYILGDGFLFKIFGQYVLIEKDKIQYNFNNPNENEEILEDFLELIRNRCKQFGFEI